MLNVKAFLDFMNYKFDGRDFTALSILERDADFLFALLYLASKGLIPIKEFLLDGSGFYDIYSTCKYLTKEDLNTMSSTTLTHNLKGLIYYQGDNFSLWKDKININEASKLNHVSQAILYGYATIPNFDDLGKDLNLKSFTYFKYKQEILDNTIKLIPISDFCEIFSLDISLIYHPLLIKDSDFHSFLTKASLFYVKNVVRFVMKKIPEKLKGDIIHPCLLPLYEENIILDYLKYLSMTEIKQIIKIYSLLPLEAKRMFLNILHENDVHVLSTFTLVDDHVKELSVELENILLYATNKYFGYFGVLMLLVPELNTKRLVFAKDNNIREFAKFLIKGGE